MRIIISVITLLIISFNCFANDTGILQRIKPVGRVRTTLEDNQKASTPNTHSATANQQTQSPATTSQQNKAAAPQQNQAAAPQQNPAAAPQQNKTAVQPSNQQPTATPTATATATAPIAPAVEKKYVVLRKPEVIYKQHCALCHNAGVAGAPKLHDPADWKARAAKGIDYMLKRAIEGFNAMPARGTCTECSDAELRYTIIYMKSKK